MPNLTHDQYLEQFHELTRKVLDEMALLHGRGDHESAGELLTALRAKQDELWSRRVASASEGVRP